MPRVRGRRPLRRHGASRRRNARTATSSAAAGWSSGTAAHAISGRMVRLRCCSVVVGATVVRRGEYHRREEPSFGVDTASAGCHFGALECAKPSWPSQFPSARPSAELRTRPSAPPSLVTGLYADPMPSGHEFGPPPGRPSPSGSQTARLDASSFLTASYSAATTACDCLP
jgi:hypothetical protein